MSTDSLAFYCSGHGFGHSTRVSAITAALLPHYTVHIVTSAPPHPFQAVLEPTASSPTPSTSQPRRYATYRYAEIDAQVVQPLAYEVDRKATYIRLKSFLEEREEKLAVEVAWLKENGITCVLSDATFLGCAAADAAGLPSILITNFTFDSIYSFLSLPPLETTPPSEPAIPHKLLAPLVDRVMTDYSKANLLLRLPGRIPIPSFDPFFATIPSGDWVKQDRTGFMQEVIDRLDAPLSNCIDVPLIVRPPNHDVYAKEFRTKLLSSVGVPTSLHGEKILLVSFGGQSIPNLDLSRRTTPESVEASHQNSTILDPASTTTALTNGNGKVKEVGLLPPGWIAIVCGLRGDVAAIRSQLPERFYSPDTKYDIHVPDFTATADVVLGKLGYGTASEVLSCRTPFVYVPRPLFVEEHGLLRLMLSRAPKSTKSISRSDFEAGRWASRILEAYESGREEKERARREGWIDEGAGERIKEEIGLFLSRWKDGSHSRR